MHGCDMKSIFATHVFIRNCNLRDIAVFVLCLLHFFILFILVICVSFDAIQLMML